MLPPVAIDALTRDRSAMSLVAANRKLYQLLKRGLPDARLSPTYTPAIFEQKCAALFEHVFESHPEWEYAGLR